MKTQKELRALIDQMTMEEKIGQLVQYNANVFTDTCNTGPGGGGQGEERGLGGGHGCHVCGCVCLLGCCMMN